MPKTVKTNKINRLINQTAIWSAKKIFVREKENIEKKPFFGSKDTLIKRKF